MKSGVLPTFAEQRIMRTNGNSDSIYLKKKYSNLNRSFQKISRILKKIPNRTGDDFTSLYPIMLSVCERLSSIWISTEVSYVLTTYFTEIRKIKFHESYLTFIEFANQLQSDCYDIRNSNKIINKKDELRILKSL